MQDLKRPPFFLFQICPNATRADLGSYSYVSEEMKRDVELQYLFGLICSRISHVIEDLELHFVNDKYALLEIYETDITIRTGDP